MGIDFSKPAAPKNDQNDQIAEQEMDAAQCEMDEALELDKKMEMSALDDAYAYIRAHHFDDERGNDVAQWVEMADLVDAFRVVRDVPGNKRDASYEECRDKAARELMSAHDYANGSAIPGFDESEQIANLENICTKDLDSIEQSILVRGKELADIQGVAFDVADEFTPRSAVFTEYAYVNDMPFHRMEQGGALSETDVEYFERAVKDELEVLREKYYDANPSSYKDMSRELFADIRDSEGMDWPERGDLSIVSDSLREELGSEYADYCREMDAKEAVELGHASGNMIVGPTIAEKEKMERRLRSAADDIANGREDSFDMERGI